MAHCVVPLRLSLRRTAAGRAQASRIARLIGGPGAHRVRPIGGLRVQHIDTGAYASVEQSSPL